MDIAIVKSFKTEQSDYDVSFCLALDGFARPALFSDPVTVPDLSKGSIESVIGAPLSLIGLDVDKLQAVMIEVASREELHFDYHLQTFTIK